MKLSNSNLKPLTIKHRRFRTSKLRSSYKKEKLQKSEWRRFARDFDTLVTMLVTIFNNSEYPIRRFFRVQYYRVVSPLCSPGAWSAESHCRSWFTIWWTLGTGYRRTPCCATSACQMARLCWGVLEASIVWHRNQTIVTGKEVRAPVIAGKIQCNFTVYITLPN